MASMRWSSEQAWAWHAKQPWLVGCNFIPSTAINQLEMWQAETFDSETIRRELGWAAGIGMNTVRVYLHDLAWEADPGGFKRRMHEYLAIAAEAGIRTLLTIFDDCWNPEPASGPQPAPIPGVHNSGWMQSPGVRGVTHPETWPRLERYVTDVVGAFAADERVLLWDVYNEPGNRGRRGDSLPLLRHAFEWARAAGPSQPVSAGLWFDDEELNSFQLQASDVITFHNYNDAANLQTQITALKIHGRPLICTEYMARTRGSRFATHLPIFKREKVGCYNWGLVSGKTQTIYQWGIPLPGREPDLWFHDIFRPDGTPYDAEEVAVIRRLARRA